jgi:hypothetical protein
MEVLSCPHCIPEVHMSDEVLNAVRDELCSLVRQNKRLQGMMVLRNKQMPLVNAKFIVLHLAQADGTCHRCGAIVEGEGAQHCKECRSLNLKWCR